MFSKPELALLHKLSVLYRPHISQAQTSGWPSPYRVNLRPWLKADESDELAELGEVVDRLAVLDQVETNNVGLSHNLIEGVADGGFVQQVVDRHFVPTLVNGFGC